VWRGPKGLLGRFVLAREIARLKALDIKRATRPGLYHDGGGLYLQVSRNGSKSWTFRYGAQGRRYVGLGATHTVALTEARERARRAELPPPAAVSAHHRCAHRRRERADAPLRPVHAHRVGREEPLRRPPGAHLRQPGEVAVETLSRSLGRNDEPLQRFGVRGSRSERRSAARRIPTPITMKLSARLNAGQ